MNKATCFYPRLRVDTAAVGAAAHPGGALLTRTVAVTGVGHELSKALSPWRKPFAVHDPGKVVCDLAIALALGGDCLADIAILRSEPRLFGLVASDATVSRTIATLADDAPKALALIDVARAAARRRTWVLAGANAPDHETSNRRPLIVDLDATLVGSYSDKEQAAPTFKRGYGFHPVRREALTIRAEVKDHRRRPCRSRAVKLRTA